MQCLSSAHTLDYIVLKITHGPLTPARPVATVVDISQGNI